MEICSYLVHDECPNDDHLDEFGDFTCQEMDLCDECASDMDCEKISVSMDEYCYFCGLAWQEEG